MLATIAPFQTLVRAIAMGFSRVPKLRTGAVEKGQLRTLAAQLTASLFDQVVGAAEQLHRDSETEGPGGLEVNDQLEFRRLLNRQVGRLSALENFSGVGPDQTVVIRFIAAVAHQAAGIDEPAKLVHGGQRMANCQLSKLFAVSGEEIVRRDDQRAHMQLDQGFKDSIEIALMTCM